MLAPGKIMAYPLLGVFADILKLTFQLIVKGWIGL